MKKTIGFLALFAILMLTACRPAVADHSAGIATAEAVAKKYADAYSSKNADQLIALLSTDYTFMDNGVNDGPYNYYATKSLIITMFMIEAFQLKISSSIVSADGRFITAVGMYTFSTKSGPPGTVPAVVILEIRDGKIASETWYYNGTWF